MFQDIPDTQRFRGRGPRFLPLTTYFVPGAGQGCSMIKAPWWSKTIRAVSDSSRSTTLPVSVRLAWNLVRCANTVPLSRTRVTRIPSGSVWAEEPVGAPRLSQLFPTPELE